MRRSLYGLLVLPVALVFAYGVALLLYTQSAEEAGIAANQPQIRGAAAALEAMGMAVAFVALALLVLTALSYTKRALRRYTRYS